MDSGRDCIGRGVAQERFRIFVQDMCSRGAPRAWADEESAFH
jgi:hypothetical protein